MLACIVYTKLDIKIRASTFRLPTKERATMSRQRRTFTSEFKLQISEVL